MKANEALPDIRKTVTLHAPIETVWKAAATSEGLAAWWMANTFEAVLGKNSFFTQEHTAILLAK